MRAYVITAAMLALEGLVLVHWYLLPESGPLFALAMGAAAVMTVMAAADVALLVGVLRRDVRNRQQRAELADLAQIEPLWAFMTICQVGFIAGAYGAGVLWIAVILTLGQGAELAAVVWARLRIRIGDAPKAAA